ncbi:Hypothetical predicted protein [Podarcis lilfordi]|uniref:Uncharacterized protein n=1 Tax=Podarcis lilfordi TaxID=74358 RepID=A0AA35K8Z9_9SAUR|nr:Hypothetical predicted protein [Podarcis lilfordi]
MWLRGWSPVVARRPQNCKVNTLSSSLCFLSLWLDSYSSPDCTPPTASADL